MDALELLHVIAAEYQDRPDEFVLSVGHWQRLYPSDDLSMENLPEFNARLSITVGQVREWCRMQ